MLALVIKILFANDWMCEKCMKSTYNIEMECVDGKWRIKKTIKPESEDRVAFYHYILTYYGLLDLVHCDLIHQAVQGNGCWLVSF